MLVDFHCHLDLFEDPVSVIEETRNRGVYVLAVTTTPLACTQLHRLIGDSPRIRMAVGLHPELAAVREAEVNVLAQQLGSTRYVGEIGIDGSPEHRRTADAQRRVFGEILRHCATAGGRVMTIHSRGAANEVLDSLEHHSGAGIPVLHWFSGSVRQLERAVQLGCWFSVGPAMLRSAKGIEIAKLVPRDRVLTETDGPFGQGQGSPLMPWDVSLALDQLGTAWQVESTVAGTIVTENFHNLVAQANKLPLD